MFNTINKILKRFVGDKAEQDYKAIKPKVEMVNEIFEGLKSISNDELRDKSSRLKVKIADYVVDQENQIIELQKKADDPNLDVNVKEGIYEEIDGLKKHVDERLEEVLEEILPETFAIVKETARRLTFEAPLKVTANQFDRDIAAGRDSVTIEGDQAVWQNSWMAAGAEVTWNMVHYDVQLVGGVALHSGKVAEMQTGEGKTLVATLPIFLNALTGKGVHVVTVNNYLAKRDSEWMGPIFEFHGMSIDCVDNHQPNSEERREAYRADITYGTNNEFGFDYLRDNMSSSPEHLVQRKHHYAIIDEVDSVLIDEARTPLIISGPTPKGDQHEYNELKPKVQLLISAQRQVVTKMLADAKKLLLGDESGTKEAATEGGLALFRCYRGLPKNKALIKLLSEEGIKQTLLKTEAYYMQDNSREMHKADEELFFVINEKQNQIELTEKGLVLMSKNMDDEQFFNMPDVGLEIANIESLELSDEDKLSKKEDLMRDFSVKSARIHTISQLLKAHALFEKDIDYVVMDNKVKIVDEQTGRMMEGRRYSDGLHQALEAKENVKVEAATQTYATVTLQNYFRMYHKLAGMTGTAETEAGELWDIYKLDVMIIPTNRPIQRDDRQDLVYRTKREKYNAVIDEIAKMREQGRPTLVGTTTVEVSELLSKMLDMRQIDHQVLNAKRHQREAEIVAAAGQPGTVTIATNMAGRGTDIKISDEVKAAGGLGIIGTERHDSRRVDRQLRGRAGRQGDPGSSQFYVSLEDDLMRLFGSDRISKMMDKIGVEEGEVIQHGLITKSIERAQKKVEENNFGIRKRLLEYDDVMNSQREVIYKRRKNALFGERLKLDIANMFYDLAESNISIFHPTKDYQGLELEVLKNFGIAMPFSEDEFGSGNVDQLTSQLYDASINNYNEKNASLIKRAYPVIEEVYSDSGNSYTNIAVPFTDGLKTLNVVSNIEKCIETKGQELGESLEKSVILGMLDNSWKEHLRDMDDLRSNVQFASHEQKDPLLIYKFESYNLFTAMVLKLNQEVASFLMKCTLPTEPNQVKQAKTPQRQNSGARVQASKAGVDNLAQRSNTARRAEAGQRPPQKKVEPIRTEKKVGRNEPCPCGSGKKYKQCHGAN